MHNRQRNPADEALPSTLKLHYPLAMELFDIFIYAAIAVFLISRLWAVLGQRDEEGEEKKRPRNPFVSDAENDEENVVVLEGRARPTDQAVAALTGTGHAPASLSGALDSVRAADPTFDEKKFLDGAKIAFTEIVSSFARGDLSAVDRFLSPSVRAFFKKAIEARQAVGQTLDNKIEKIVAADIVAARTEGSLVALTVEFVSHQTNLLRDSTGRVLDGTPGQAEEVRDLWVFQRDGRADDPNWLLLETKA